jgi:quercetin dioxygenase-like cupin family protein
MRVIDSGKVELETTDSPIFIDGEVRRRQLVGPETGENIRAALVRFAPGARSVWDVHDFDQLLYIVEGRGIMATEEAEHIVVPGIVVYIPARERHWHGGTATTSMAHLTIRGASQA